MYGQYVVHHCRWWVHQWVFSRWKPHHDSEHGAQQSRSSTPDDRECGAELGNLKMGNGWTPFECVRQQESGQVSLSVRCYTRRNTLSVRRRSSWHLESINGDTHCDPVQGSTAPCCDCTVLNRNGLITVSGQNCNEAVQRLRTSRMFICILRSIQQNA